MDSFAGFTKNKKNLEMFFVEDDGSIAFQMNKGAYT